MMSLNNLIYVFIGGGTGAVCRCLVTNYIGSVHGIAFPFGTLTVNVIGSFLIGLIMTFAINNVGILSDAVRFLLVVGFLGGFTTFSSFSLETLTLIKAGSSTVAIFNIFGNVILGLLAAMGSAMLSQNIR